MFSYLLAYRFEERLNILLKLQKCALPLLVHLLAWCLLWLSTSCTNSAESGSGDSSSAIVYKKILFLGSTSTIDARVTPEHLFPYRIQKRLAQQKLPFKVINAGIARETPQQLQTRWPQLLQNDPVLIVLELSQNPAQTELKPLLQHLLQDISPRRLMLWTPPALGQPLPLQLAEQLKVSLLEVPIPNEDWESQAEFHEHLAQQLWPAIERKIKDIQ